MIVSAQIPQITGTARAPVSVPATALTRYTTLLSKLELREAINKGRKNRDDFLNVQQQKVNIQKEERPAPVNFLALNIFPAPLDLFSCSS